MAKKIKTQMPNALSTEEIAYMSLLESAYNHSKSHYYGSKETNNEAQYANWLKSLFE